jgi:transketolase
VTIFASGSEIEIALEAHKALEANGHTTRVVSVPCFELFEEQSAEYKSAVIGDSKVKIAIEAGIRQGGTASSAPTACSSA